MKTLCTCLIIAVILSSCLRDQAEPVGLIQVTPEVGTRYTIFQFDAKDSYDSNSPGHSLKYRWDIYGDGIWEYDFSSIGLATYKFDSIGIHKVILEVINPEGNTGRNEVFIEVSDQNSPPIAILKAFPQKGSLSTEISFDASQSYDQEESKMFLKYRWDFFADGTWDIDFGDQSEVSITFSEYGKIKVLVEVIDSEETSSQSLVQVDIKNTYNEYSFVEDSRDGRIYSTVKIGQQWVMAENLCFGDFVDNAVSPMNNGVCEIFAYDNKPDNIVLYGGLYLWSEAMSYQVNSESRGVCPAGWHIPSETEWQNLELDLGIDNLALSDSTWGRLEGFGTLLRYNQSSGFDGGLYGYRKADYTFAGAGKETKFWSSTIIQSSGKVFTRGLSVYGTGILRIPIKNNTSLPVRCFRNI